MKTRFAVATLGAMLLAAPALAQDAPPPPRPHGGMAGADADHDGTITKAEYLARVEARFARLDTNHDGKIDATERAAAHHGGGDMAARMGKRMDANGDGSVTLDEERAKASRRFDRMDTNHDGKIDQAERDAIRERMRAMRGPMGSPQTPPAGTPDQN